MRTRDFSSSRQLREVDARFPQGSDGFFRNDEGPVGQGNSRRMPHQERPGFGIVRCRDLDKNFHKSPFYSTTVLVSPPWSTRKFQQHYILSPFVWERFL